MIHAATGERSFLSGFCLIRTASAEQRHEQERDAICQLGTRGFSEVILKRMPAFSLVLFGKTNGRQLELAEDGDNDFAFGAGAVIYDDLSGRDAVSRILIEFDGTAKILDMCSGDFSLVIYKYNVLHILTNKSGSSLVFYDDSISILSNSFLCLCNLLQKLSINTHNLYEFVGKGFVTGDETPFEQCRSLGPGAHLVFDGLKMLNQSAAPLPPVTFGGSFEDGLEVAAELLRQKFARIVAGYGDDITCALSGGFDLRLMLALLLDQGVCPALFVYGADRDPDVLISTSICEGEGFELRHVNKDATETPSPDEFGHLVRLNFQSDDGYFWSGIFNNGAELMERRIRSRHSLTLNGGGGEILRVFFQLLDRPYTIKQFVQAFYLDVDDCGFSQQFSRAEFIENIAVKVRRIIQSGSEKLDRHIIEWLYPVFRCRSFFARHESIYNLDGPSIVPFFDVDVGSFGAGLPIRWKRGGFFEAKLICKLAPRLAAYSSAYGASFSDPIGWKRLAMEVLSSARPPALRHSLWLLQNTLQLNPRYADLFLSQPYVDSVFKDRDYIMARFFHIPSVINSAYVNRIYTLEYLAREFASKLSSV